MNSITWQSPSNIALVKYWGKKDYQIPMNPSISFTLSNAVTETTIAWQSEIKSKNIEVNLSFEGKGNQAFQERLQKFVNSIIAYIPSLKGLKLNIESKNSFPHSSGIASSASALSAVALCLLSIEKELSGKYSDESEFFKTASILARLGSGSASRSVYGGINLWGEIDSIKESSNEYSLDISKHCHNDFMNYGDAILLVSDKTKKISSSLGHSLMKNHPYAKNKFIESYKNTNRMLDILKSGDLADFTNLVEAEALALHAMMMTSTPSYLLMEPNTLSIINSIRAFRQTSGIQLCFTLDAGANVHLLYPMAYKTKVSDFVNDELLHFCSNTKWIDDRVGSGPVQL